MPNGKIAVHIGWTLAYFGVGFVAAPKLLGRLTRSRWNVLAATSPIAYVVVVLLAYAAVASLFDISLVFAAFLAGYAMVAEQEVLGAALTAVSEFSFAVFIPIYFAVVGYKLDLSKTFSFAMLAVFLVLSSGVKLASAGLGARLAGFGYRDSVNLAAALNARGGPGNCAGQCGVRCGNYQCDVLYDAGSGCHFDEPGGGGVAGLRSAERATAAFG